MTDDGRRPRTLKRPRLLRTKFSSCTESGGARPTFLMSTFARLAVEELPLPLPPRACKALTTLEDPAWPRSLWAMQSSFKERHFARQCARCLIPVPEMWLQLTSSTSSRDMFGRAWQSDWSPSSQIELPLSSRTVTFVFGKTAARVFTPVGEMSLPLRSRTSTELPGSTAAKTAMPASPKDECLKRNSFMSKGAEATKCFAPATPKGVNSSCVPRRPFCVIGLALRVMPQSNDISAPMVMETWRCGGAVADERRRLWRL
mmetsp:Transcript_97980/g.204388  ORF Transcript_97980/g.204388 Transcript_97980/m.204388 type:complete len:259 (-) Transcript_97980:169-945(-)